MWMLAAVAFRRCCRNEGGACYNDLRVLVALVAGGVFFGLCSGAFAGGCKVGVALAAYVSVLLAPARQERTAIRCRCHMHCTRDLADII